ncbi:hypothetical protein, partial [Leptospira noguchii]
QALHGNPYDGHTLKDAINQMEKIVGIRPKEVYALNHSRNSASHSQWVARRDTKVKIIILRMFKFIFPIKAERK